MSSVTSLRGGPIPRSPEVVAPLAAEAGVLVRGRTKPFLLAGAVDGAKSLVLEPVLKLLPR